jgi:protein-disulfide isomerase
VLQSRWGLLSLGPVQIPVAVLGASYFMVLAVWLAVVGRLPGRLHHACLGPALLATAGAAESAYLIYVMGSKLHAWCGFCLGAHAVNFLLMTGLWAQWLAGCRPREEYETAPVRQLWKVPALAMVTAVMLGVTLAAIFGLAGMLVLYHSMAWEVAKMQQDEQYQRWKFAQVAPQRVPVRADDPVRGPADASHTVVMFGDFQCATCATTDKTLKQVQTALGGQFRLVFKHYPLNRSCNAWMNKDKAGHAFGCLAAEAAEAARRLGGNAAFWKMHDALYDKQRELDERPYAKLAASMGLDPAAFEKMLADPATRERVEQDASLGHELGVTATPVVFLDGRQVTLNVVLNPMTQETDLDATVRHWRGLLASADEAAATRPATALSRSPSLRPTASGIPFADGARPLAQAP